MQECVSRAVPRLSGPVVSVHCITYRTLHSIELDRVPYGISDMNNQMPNLRERHTQETDVKRSRCINRNNKTET